MHSSILDTACTYNPPDPSTFYGSSGSDLHVHVVSFPGLLWLQFLIAYSMQKWREKAWEISSHAMTSGTQRVDRRGQCLTVVIHKSCIDQPQVYWTSCIDAAFKGKSLKIKRALRFFVGHCLLLYMQQNLLLLLFLYTVDCQGPKTGWWQRPGIVWTPDPSCRARSVWGPY